MKNQKVNQKIHIECVNGKGRYGEWIKNHRKKLILTGVSITCILGVVIGVKSKMVVKEITKVPEKKLGIIKGGADRKAMVSETAGLLKTIDVVEKEKVSKDSTEVCSHIRNLPDGWKASTEKIVTAAEKGYVLEEGQTWVEMYIKERVVA